MGTLTPSGGCGCGYGCGCGCTNASRAAARDAINDFIRHDLGH